VEPNTQVTIEEPTETVAVFPACNLNIIAVAVHALSTLYPRYRHRAPVIEVTCDAPARVLQYLATSRREG
jgi:hypothetical protein